MNVRELMTILADADPENLVLVSGYEGGYTTVAAASVRPMQQLDRGDDWNGAWETPEVAAEQISPPKPGSWREMLAPPTLVGGPVVALVISRSGR
ncbi:MAG: hypothetical protein H6523_12975 [Mycolicibacterium sp.]|nr:hypothetical protein [Mycolicibacterium sp.]